MCVSVYFNTPCNIGCTFRRFFPLLPFLPSFLASFPPSFLPSFLASCLAISLSPPPLISPFLSFPFLLCVILQLQLMKSQNQTLNDENRALRAAVANATTHDDTTTTSSSNTASTERGASTGNANASSGSHTTTPTRTANRERLLQSQLHALQEENKLLSSKQDALASALRRAEKDRTHVEAELKSLFTDHIRLLEQRAGVSTANARRVQEIAEAKGFDAVVRMRVSGGERRLFCLTL